MTEVIEKPVTDHREYRHVVLDNGIRVVVISDSKCDKSAGALSVKVGSLFDPPEVQGLAHFLEHMLFLGTEKYPQEDEYNEFLAKHGGMSNAYTADTVTNFYFGVTPDHLKGALDRFSQFFISPLFMESATDRELKAVESEHSKNKQNDGWRWNQLLKSDANPKHPLCHFGTGNVETLKTIPERDAYPVRKRLLEFHDTYYSSNLMCMSVLGKESLEELEAIVREMFEPVVNKKAVVPEGLDIGKGEPTYLKDSFPRLVRIIPVRDVRSISFQFVLPQQSPMRWRTKPCRYLSFLIGHEGKGSVLSALKAEKLATELMAGPSMDDAGCCIFEVGLQLTEKGEAEIQRVGEFVFTYIRLMQQLPVKEELFRETQCIEEMNFRFRSVANPISMVSGLSHSMQDGLPTEKLLSGAAKVWELDVEQIAEVAGHFTCSNLRVAFATKSFTEHEHCQDTEPWYGTRFSAQSLPEEWHKAWEARRTAEGGGEAAVAAAAELGLMLPLKNPFIAEDLNLKQQPEGGVEKFPARLAPLPETLGAALLARASLVGGPTDPSQVIQVYFRQDDKFELPKACVNIEIYCPWPSQSRENRTATSAWCHAVAEELTELSYDSDVAGLFYSITASSRCISVKLAGYQDKLPVLLRTISQKMASMGEVSEHIFSLIHTVMLRNAKNASKTRQPHQQAAEFESRCVNRSAITCTELLEEIQTLTREKLNGVNAKLLDECYAEVLVQGNVTSVEAGHLLEGAAPILHPSIVGSIPPVAVGALPNAPGTCALFRQNGTNPEELNGATTVLMQAAEDTLENVVFVELTAQVLSQRCFDELRTKQQLGYIVALQPYADGSVGGGFCGLRVIVQSERHPADVHRRIDVWLAAALSGLVDEEGTPNEKLAEYLDSLLTLKKEKAKKLADEFAINWSEIRSRRFRFTRKDEVIAFLERPQTEILQEFRTFIRDKVIPAPKFAVEIMGSAAQAKEAKAKEGASGTDSSEPPKSQEEAGEAKSDESPADPATDDPASLAPYEDATEYLSSIADIEAFRERMVWHESNTCIKV